MVRQLPGKARKDEPKKLMARRDALRKGDTTAQKLAVLLVIVAIVALIALVVVFLYSASGGSRQVTMQELLMKRSKEEYRWED